MNTQSRKFSKTEMRILLAACAGILVCVYFLLIGDSRSSDSTGIEVGFVTFHENDTRQKSKSKFVWNKLEDHQRLHVGDSVFSGPASKIQVDLLSGDSVNIGENSLVTFDLIQEKKVMNLTMGNFRLKVDGEIQVAMRGELTTLEGKNAELQLFIGKDNKPKLKVLKGKTEIKTKEKSIEVKTDSFTELPEPKADPQHVLVDPPPPIESLTQAPPPPVAEPAMQETTASSEAPPTPVPAPAAEPTLAAVETMDQSSLVPDNWKFDDLYERKESLVFKKPALTKKEAQYNAEAEPKPERSEIVLPLVRSQVETVLNLPTKVPVSGVMVESSDDGLFDDTTKPTPVYPSTTIPLQFKKTGEYYFRFRGLLPNQEISDWSKTVKVRVFKPEAPAAPTVESAKQITSVVGENLKLSWKPEESPERTKIEIFNEKSERVFTERGTQHNWKPAKAGIYRARAYSVNRYGQRSPASEIVEIKVTENPIVAEKPKAPPALARETAATETESVMNLAIGGDLLPANDSFKSSSLSLTGFLWTLQGTDLKASGNQSPIASGFGLQGLFWLNRHGLEGSLKSGVAAANTAGQEIVSVKDYELRYHYRFLTNFPFSWGKELQTSPFVGYEMYRNSGSLVAANYDLLKLGVALQFSVSKYWGGGGEFVYGSAGDKSTKQEMSGFLKYYFDSQWSLGAGYRIHLFNAGSKDSSPTRTLPYREGYTEGFSVLTRYY